MKEVWKDVVEYEGIYEVSDIGNVRRTSTKRLLSPRCYKKGDGYNKVTLSKDGKTKSWIVHRLVAIAFIPNPNNKPVVNHKDKNRTNNVVSNLEWCTHKENLEHGWTTGENKLKYLSQEEIDEIRRLYKEEFVPKMYHKLAERFGVSHSTICKVIERKERYEHV